jgi:Mycothiol maleylpyruvate isomerase N-terminal domain
MRSDFVGAAKVGRDLIAHPRVTETWDDPSALHRMSVGALACHLARQIILVKRALKAPSATQPLATLAEHYERALWVGADVDAEINVAIRQGGERVAAAGPDVLLARLDRAIKLLDTAIGGVPDGHQVTPPAGPWSLAFDDFLTTRLMEIVVHSDDLACSVGVATPEVPDGAEQQVLGLLVDLARRRHGAPAVLRALTRRERAPESILIF